MEPLHKCECKQLLHFCRLEQNDAAKQKIQYAMDQICFWMSCNAKVNTNCWLESEHQATFSSPYLAFALLVSSISWLVVQCSQVFKFTEGQELLPIGILKVKPRRCNSYSKVNTLCDRYKTAELNGIPHCFVFFFFTFSFSRSTSAAGQNTRT